MINENRLIGFFKTICKIPSLTKEEAKISTYLRSVLENLGFECWEDHAGEKTGGNANNLYGLLKGNPKYKSICFVAHMDSVQSLENLVIIEDENVIKSDGTTILGGDDKAGIAIIIEAIKQTIESKKEHGDIYVLFLVQEENGQGSVYVEKDNFNPDFTFNFDESVPALSFETDGPTEYRNTYKISMPKSEEQLKINKSTYKNIGENPITVASRAIAEITDLTKNTDVKCNIGFINGGLHMYRIPDVMEFHILLRCEDDNKAIEYNNKIHDIVEKYCKLYNAECSFDEWRCYIAFKTNKNDPIRKLIDKTCNDMGEKPIIRENFDCFDTSSLNDLGIKTVTCATGYDNYHQTTECLYKDQFIKNAEFAVKLIENIKDL